MSAAVIGCGRGGRLSLDALIASPRYSPVAAADTSSSVLEQLGARCPGISTFDDYRDLLATIDANVVCIATPAPTHERVARQALDTDIRGLLLEKPLTCRAANAAELLQDIRDHELPTVVPHGMLVLPAPQEVKLRVRRGDIGTVTRVEVQNDVDLLNAGIHWLVFLLDLFDDDEPVSVDASFDTRGHDVNDGVQVETRGETRIDLASGMRWNLISGSAARPVSESLPADERRGALFRIVATAGVVEFSAWSGSYRIVRAGARAAERVDRSAESSVSYHQTFLEQLAESIAAARPDYRSAELSVAALRLIETAYQQHHVSDWTLGRPAFE